ncbi:MAG TPA: hypothetical protein VKI61_15245 [Chitinophagaceae bacterium]|nr:hypothetical protein [Chitinophagaceae bacterium]
MKDEEDKIENDLLAETVKDLKEEDSAFKFYVRQNESNKAEIAILYILPLIRRLHI